jgi:hypothetical protein
VLRLLVLALLLANAGYFAWAQGLLAGYGFAPLTQAEPQRLTQQIRPEAMQLLNTAEPPRPEFRPVAYNPALNPAFNPAAAAIQCVQAGLFSDEQASALRPRLQASLPAGSWSLENSVEPSRWIIYMGKYAGDEALAKKRNELRLRGISFEPLLNPALGPGLSLGHFNSQADASDGLSKISQRGVRTARVVQERPEARGQLLRLASADAPLLAQLDTLKAQLAGKALQACR